jgi:quercetin dioxygenase-like cupin family protein
MSAPAKPLISQPGVGQVLSAFGNNLTVMLGGEQTGGMFAVMLEETPPGGGPPLHVHSHEDEIFLVVEGRISYFVEECWIEVAPGGLVYLPKGVAHRYQNVGATPSRHWILTMPSGFETFFERCAEEFARSGSPDMPRVNQIHREHGIELLGEEFTRKV